MPLYEVGLLEGGGLDVDLGHSHTGWEAPIEIVGRQVFRTSKGNYRPGELDVAISAEPEGEEGMTLVFPPAYQETTPSEGVFTLAQALPDGWKIKVRCAYT